MKLSVKFRLFGILMSMEGMRAKTPGIDEFAEFVIQGFKSKPWVVDAWRKSGAPLKDSVEWSVDIDSALVSFKIKRDAYSQKEWDGLPARVEKAIESVTEKPTGHFFAY